MKVTGKEESRDVGAFAENWSGAQHDGDDHQLDVANLALSSRSEQHQIKRGTSGCAGPEHWREFPYSLCSRAVKNTELFIPYKLYYLNNVSQKMEKLCCSYTSIPTPNMAQARYFYNVPC